MFRLHYDEPEPIKTPADVQAGLDMWRKINQMKGRWAVFEAIQFTKSRVVHVIWGYTLSDGTKERAIQWYTFSLNGDDTVNISQYTNP